MRVIMNIFLWLLAYLVSTLITAFLVTTRFLDWLLDPSSSREIPGFEPIVPLQSFVDALVFNWVIAVPSALPFVIIFSGVPEAFGIKPSRWRYAGFGGGTAICLIYLHYYTGGVVEFDLWAGLIVFWSVVGGFIMGHLRLGILRPRSIASGSSK